MKQSSLDLNLSIKKTRKQELLAQMDLVEGSGKKHLLTFTFTHSRLLLA